jgi:hypothetical protein
MGVDLIGHFSERCSTKNELRLEGDDAHLVLVHEMEHRERDDRSCDEGKKVVRFTFERRGACFAYLSKDGSGRADPYDCQSLRTHLRELDH